MNRGRTGEGLVLAFLFAMALYHATLLGQGALAFPDEHLYGNALDAAQAMSRGDFREAAAALSGWGSRPAEYLSRLPAAFIQLAAQRRTGLSPLSPESLPIVTAQNVLVAFLLGLTFFRLSQKLLSPGAAILATVAFSSLTVNHVWVRHVVPYDIALLAHLVALRMSLELPADPPTPGFLRRALVAGGLACFLAVSYPLAFHLHRSLGFPVATGILLGICGLVFWLGRREPIGTFRVAVRAGLVSGLALALYPAYYSFVPALGIMILCSGRVDRVLSVSMASVRNGVFFAAGAALVVSTFEVLARLGDVSYLGGARLLASTITQGNFDEGFGFLVKWLWALDGPTAIWVFPASLLGTFLLIFRWSTKSTEGSAVARICLILGALYSVYAFQSVVLQRMVFTGRYARIYIPVMLWLAAYGLSRISHSRLRTAAFVCAGTISFGGFIQFAVAYREVGYPADALYSLKIGYEDVVGENIRHEFAILPNYNLPVKAVTAAAPYVTVPNDQRYVLFNFALPSLEAPALPAPKRPGPTTLLYDALHFCSFASTAWEGYPAAKRSELVSRRFRLSVYQPRTGGV